MMTKQEQPRVALSGTIVQGWWPRELVRAGRPSVSSPISGGLHGQRFEINGEEPLLVPRRHEEIRRVHRDNCGRAVHGEVVIAMSREPAGEF